MSTGGITTFTTNANEVRAKLGRGAAKIENPRGFLQQVRELLQTQEQDVWSTEGSLLGTAWKSLVEPERGSGRMLVGSGKLYDSMAGPDAGAIRGATLRVHPKPYYGFFHQFGTATMDARQFSGISESTNREIIRLFEQVANQDLTE
jgi:phage gpG-like protein